VQITGFEARISVDAVMRRGREPVIDHEVMLELRGTMDESIRDVRDVVIWLYPQASAEDPLASASVGTVAQVRLHILATVGLTSSNFDRVWSLALSGSLQHASLAMTKPHYNGAYVTGVRFSNHPVPRVNGSGS
jgi:hypothetical protein